MIKCSKLDLEGALLFENLTFKDNRGSFSEVFKDLEYSEHLQEIKFIQDNESVSKYGVLRGLHYQKSNYEQSKLVRVSYGEVQDVIVDIRNESSTFGKHISVILSKENGKQLFVPKGFAHGFLVLSDFAIVNYKVDNVYSPKHELGLLYSDKNLNIKWGLETDSIVVSQRDLDLPTLNKI